MVLPHEDVDARRRSRTARCSCARPETNLEPILLVHEGTPALLATYDGSSGASPWPPSALSTAAEHRLWSVTASAELDHDRRSSRRHQALIADGHHRYAAYLRAGVGARATPDSPWSFGLAMLVADDGQSLRIGPIHRVVAGLTMRDVDDAAADRGDRFELVEAPDLAAENAAGHATFWLSDGVGWARLQVRRTSPVDAAILHEELLPALARRRGPDQLPPPPRAGLGRRER